MSARLIYKYCYTNLGAVSAKHAMSTQDFRSTSFIFLFTVLLHLSHGQSFLLLSLGANVSVMRGFELM